MMNDQNNPAPERSGDPVTAWRKLRPIHLARVRRLAELRALIAGIPDPHKEREGVEQLLREVRERSIESVFTVQREYRDARDDLCHWMQRENIAALKELKALGKRAREQRDEAAVMRQQAQALLQRAEAKEAAAEAREEVIRTIRDRTEIAIRARRRYHDARAQAAADVERAEGAVMTVYKRTKGDREQVEQLQAEAAAVEAAIQDGEQVGCWPAVRGVGGVGGVGGVARMLGAGVGGRSRIRPRLKLPMGPLAPWPAWLAKLRGAVRWHRWWGPGRARPGAMGRAWELRMHRPRPRPT